MHNIVKYHNGNYNVMLDLDNGTKIRYNNEDALVPEFPESMDVLISKRCNTGCPMCHEQCTPDGEFADIMSPSFIDTLHPYTEIALNGNEPLHPDLIPFLRKCKSLNLIPSLTVHQKTFIKNFGLFNKITHSRLNDSDGRLIYGLGVSLSNVDDKLIELLKYIPNAVVHTICGVTTIDEFEKLAFNELKVLILGYKRFGRGTDFYGYNGLNILCNQNDLYNKLPEMFNDGWFDTLSFDNLAIEQLDVNRLISDDEWNKFYMGDDGEYTFYVDMVNKQFAKSSTSTTRFDMLDNAKDMFDIVMSNRQN